MRQYIKSTPINTEHLTDMPKHFLRSASYYARECEKLGVELESCRVITDDPTYAKHLLPHCKQLATKSDVEAFCLMVGAKHFIPSGSQFSFWAKYLQV